jgi:hypothetical protein
MRRGATAVLLLNDQVSKSAQRRTRRSCEGRRSCLSVEDVEVVVGAGWREIWRTDFA